MAVNCSKCSKFTKKNNIKIKQEIDGKNFHSCCIDCNFKMSETIEK